MNLNDCQNFDDFRKLAKKKLPSPIFHYIDGGSDDEITLKRNTDSFNQCDLIPNVLAGGGKPDISTEIFGRKISMPIFLSPTAMQRLYDPEGDKASARAAEKLGTMYGMSTMATSSIEEIANISSGPKLFQLYIHKDKSITDDLIDRCKIANFDGLCLTVDTIVAGNRERDHRTGFTTPPKLTIKSLFEFAAKPGWVFDYLTNKKFELSNVKHKTDKGTNITKSVIEYVNEQYDPGMNWQDAEYCIKKWNGPFALKGVEIILDGGVRRGTHVLKAVAAGAKACSFGKMFLFSLASGGQAGVERALQNMQKEIERNMLLMGCKSLKELNSSKIIYKK